MDDLAEVLRKATHPMLAWLSNEHGRCPTLGYEVAHDTGRWWDAAVRLEETIGWEIPPKIEACMHRNLQKLTSNPDGLLTTEDSYPNNRRRINLHNLRETMIACSALARSSRDDMAIDAGRRLLRTIDRCLRPDGHLRAADLRLAAELPPEADTFTAEDGDGTDWFDATQTTGRCLEAVIPFYEATGDPLAMRVATRLAELHLRLVVDENQRPRRGFWSAGHTGHNHSYLGTLRGLLDYGILTGQRQYVDAVASLYETSIWVHNIEADGWTTHDIGDCGKNVTGKPTGESASSMDVAMLALKLAIFDHRAELLEDVEKIVRSSVLPRQVDKADLGIERQDGRTITERWLWGWGCLLDRDSRDCTFDVHAHVASALCDVHDAVVAHRPEVSVVNLHFCREDERIRVKAWRDERGGHLHVEPLEGQGLMVRVPSWAPPQSVKLTRHGRSLEFVGAGRYVAVAPGREAVEIEYDLPVRESTAQTPSGSIAIRWRGDTAESVTPMAE